MKNIVWHDHKIKKEDRESLLNQKGCILWFTGLSGSGKSTIASLLQEKLYKNKKITYLLDGDNIRHGLNSDLGFSEKDREENIRRIGEVSKLFVDAGLIVMTAFISPFRKDRYDVRSKVERFIEIYLDCSLDECEKRDPKGLYKKARKGEIKDFTGITQGYEKPLKPEIFINTCKFSASESADFIFDYLKEHKII